MNLEINDRERELLAELFDEKQKHLIREINHTDTIDYERLLKQKLEVLEGLMRRMGQDPRQAD
jgi:hypothetical protein